MAPTIRLHRLMAAQIVNWRIADAVPAAATAEMIRQSWNGQYGWRWMFTAVAVPSLVFLAGSLYVPESPRRLAGRGQKDRARRTLVRIGEAYASAALAGVFTTMEAHCDGEPTARPSRNVLAVCGNLFCGMGVRSASSFRNQGQDTRADRARIRGLT
jgi:hypothetical protein